MSTPGRHRPPLGRKLTMTHIPIHFKLELSLEIGPELARTIITIAHAGLYYLIAGPSPLG